MSTPFQRQFPASPRASPPRKMKLTELVTPDLHLLQTSTRRRKSTWIQQEVRNQVPPAVSSLLLGNFIRFPTIVSSFSCQMENWSRFSGWNAGVWLRFLESKEHHNCKMAARVLLYDGLKRHATVQLYLYQSFQNNQQLSKQQPAPI